MDNATDGGDAWLEHVPDGMDVAAGLAWVRRELPRLPAMDFAGDPSARFFSIVCNAIAGNAPAGRPAAAAGRRFALALLLADWACYPRPADREEYAHLHQALTVFPAGFRLWLGRIGADPPVPVGYSAWHPIPEAVYRRLRDTPEQITDRRQIGPACPLKPGRNHAYLYNCSILPNLYKTPASKGLVRTLAADIGRHDLAGLAAVVVSADGQRLAGRFGLGHSGAIRHAGWRQEVFTGVLPGQPRS